MFAVAAIAAVSMSATAQVTYGNDYSYKPTSSRIYGSDNENFGLLYVQFSPSKMHSKVSFNGKSESDSESVNVLSVGYTYNIALGEDLPLYLSPGGAIQWFFKSKKEKISDQYYDYGDILPSDYSFNYEYTNKFNMISIKIPVTVMYSFELGEAFRIEPYAGVYGRVNLWAEQKTTSDYGSSKVNPFDKKEMGDEHVWKRIQAGWTAGVNFRITNAFTVGAGYYMDLLKLADYKEGSYKASSHFDGFDITLGVNF